MKGKKLYFMGKLRDLDDPKKVEADINKELKKSKAKDRYGKILSVKCRWAKDAFEMEFAGHKGIYPLNIKDVPDLAFRNLHDFFDHTREQNKKEGGDYIIDIGFWVNLDLKTDTRLSIAFD